ncbi:MAG: hypothetical protein AAF829_03225 [Pseudomonadota bacterium]
MILPKPYADYVGRSTTPLRAIFALLVANLAVPLVITGTMFIPAWVTGNADWDTWSANAQQFRSVWMLGAAFAAPFIWIIGGVVWMVAHGTRKNGPAAALLAGGGVASFFGALVALLSSVGSDPSLQDALGAFLSLVFLFLFGAFGAAIVWIVAYKARPVRPSRGMEFS